MSTPTLERGIDQNEKEKNVIERRGRVTFRPGIAKVARSVSRNEWGKESSNTVEATEHLSSVHLFSFHETRTESRYDRTTLASRPLNTQQRWNRLRVTFFLRYWIIARSRTKRTSWIEREHANRPFRFLLRKVTDSLTRPKAFRIDDWERRHEILMTSLCVGKRLDYSNVEIWRWRWRLRRLLIGWRQKFNVS